ncbi:formin-like protein 7 [Megalobrama amblycephala]|uniref:formin-like protein 7 n=1 Tax=Megalobrama amblycephala TaxID=75352 RepID=UPI0020141AF0|nr:formin-like protein 7 [Megalobrama amblycephala]
MSEIGIFPSDDESLIAQDPSPHHTDARSTCAQPQDTCVPPQDTATEPPVPSRGRRPSRAASRTPRRRGLPSPPPSRHPPSSSASSYTSAHPTIPAIEKWTVLGLRQALISADVHFSRRMNKAELYNLYVSLQSAFPSPKSTPLSKTANKPNKNSRGPNQRSQKTPSPTLARKGLQVSGRGSRPSASLGRAPDSTAVSPHSHLRSAELQTAAPHVTIPASIDTNHPGNVSMPPPAAQAQPQPFPISFFNPIPCQWPAAPPSVSSARLPPLAVQAQTPYIPPQFPSFSTLLAPGADPSARLPPQAASAPACLPSNTFSHARSPFTLFSATAMPIPPNTTALEPPPVASNIRAQILTVCFPEIQIAGTRGGPISNPSTSLFRTDVPINHPLKPLLDASLNSIIQAVSPRTLQSYLTAWKCFKSFHSTYSLPFPDFSLLNITSFISYLNSIKNLQASSIKGYLSGIQFFHKLIFGSPSSEIANSQTSMLIKGIQKTQPTCPDARQPITLDILTRCITILRRGYHSINTAHTLDAMFILAFFGFLRCSELTITSNFNPKVHPTISDLSVLDDDTISYFIKQSKTDQTRKGHFIYIFNLSSPIQPYQSLLAYLHFRSSQAKFPSDPLFTDDSNHPITRFWFQKHLKAVLIQSGIPAANYSSHSFRIGAATTAAQKGLSQHQIQALGRWSSEAYKSYIRSNRFHIKEAQQTLIS